MSAVAFELWAAALRLVYAEGVLQEDGVMRWTWWSEAEAQGHDCRSIPDGVELLQVLVGPAKEGTNSERLLRVWRRSASGARDEGRKALHVTWDEADGEPTAAVGLNVEIFERGLWESALLTRAKNGVIA